MSGVVNCAAYTGGRRVALRRAAHRPVESRAWDLGYALVLAAMLGACGSIYVYFKRSGWF